MVTASERLPSRHGEAMACGMKLYLDMVAHDDLDKASATQKARSEIVGQRDPNRLRKGFRQYARFARPEWH